ncbi:MAG: trypsin-like peptidase domain-containing protein [Thermoguttaceae bacterium]|nr:trypsin-like peptidase domain-containing protein [Thermoguttaceae bacterium]MDW8036569.1 trypsin-like peptidase domain-containing protein [Thermoguttaceae bacterium]
MRGILWTCWWLWIGWLGVCSKAAGSVLPEAGEPPAVLAAGTDLLVGSVALQVPKAVAPVGCAGASCGEPTSQAFAPSGVHPAVCRLIHTLPGGLRAIGTGVLVDKEGQYGLIITCQHLFREGVGRITVVFPDGQTYEARLLHQDPVADLAALLIARPSAEPVPVATKPPQPGEPVQSCGYGPDGRYWCNQGQVIGYSRTGLSAGWETLELTGRARQGDSGGPVFNAQGELVAVIWGTDGRTVSGTYNGRVDRFLQQTGRYLLPWNAKNNRPNPTPSHPPSCPTNPAPVDPPRCPANPGARPAPGAEGGILSADLKGIEARLDRILDLLSQGRPGQPAQGLPTGQPGLNPGSSAGSPTGPGGASPQVPPAVGSAAPADQSRAESSLLRQAVQQLIGELGSLPERIQARIEKVQAAGAHTAPETIRAYVQDFLAEKMADGSLGWTMGKLLAAALGLSGPLALSLTVGAWLIGRRIGRKLQTGEPLLVQQLAERIGALLGQSQPAKAPVASSTQAGSTG